MSINLAVEAIAQGCTVCGYEFVDDIQTETSHVTYCQQCGHTTEERRSAPKIKFEHVRKPPAPGKGKAIGALIPLADKKKKK